MLDGNSSHVLATGLAITKNRIHFLATFDSLEYLRRGGRISKGKFFIGSLLGIHPLISLIGGRVAPAGSTLNRKKALDRLYNFAAGFRNVEKIGIAHAACPEDAEALMARINKSFPNAEIHSSRLTPVMGAHTGPGLVLVTVLGDK